MKLIRPNNRQTGLTMIELLVVLATLGLLALLLLRSSTIDKRPYTTACMSNLKQVTLAETVWASDHDSTNTFPAQRSTNFGGFRELLGPSGLHHYYMSLSNELISPRVLTCPTDNRKPADDFASLTTQHLSYFLNMDVKSDEETSTVLHGDRHIVFKPAARLQIVTLTSNLSVGWANNIHVKRRQVIELRRQRTGNIAFADGSVAKSDDRVLTDSLAPSRVAAHRLLFP